MANRHAGFLAVATLALGLAACADTPSEPEAARQAPVTRAPSFNISDAEDNFSTNSLSNYTIYNSPGAWSISGGYLHANNTAVQSVVIRNGQTLADGFIEAETDEFSDGGLVLRFQSAGNYYLLAVRDDSRFAKPNLEIYRVQNGTYFRIAGPNDVEVPRGVQHTIRFQAVGSRLQAWVDGQLSIAVTDYTYASGSVGVRHDNTHGEPGITSRYNRIRWGLAYNKDDFFWASSLNNYTIYNTPGAWSITNGYLQGDHSAMQSVVIANGSTITNGVVEVESDQITDGGLVQRFQSNGNYYLLAVRDDSQYPWANLEIYRAQNGGFLRIAGPVDLDITPGVPYTVSFSAQGSLLQARVNGELSLAATDYTYTSGMVGVRHDNTHQYGPQVITRYNELRWASF